MKAVTLVEKKSKPKTRCGGLTLVADRPPPSHSLLPLLNWRGAENKMEKLMGQDKDWEGIYQLL